MDLSHIARRTVADEVANRLRDRILAGSIPDGTWLRQEAVAAELGVSRIPVREALTQLEGEGLLQLKPHRGAFVTVLRAEDAVELFAMRVAIEPVLLHRSTALMTDGDLTRAAEALAAFDTSVAAGDAGRWGELNWRFHAALYQPAGWPRMLRLAHELNNSSARYVRLHLGLRGAVPQAAEDHRELLALCAAGEADAAATSLRQHIESAGRALAAFLERRSAEEAA